MHPKANFPSIALVSSTSRGRTEPGPFLAIKNVRATTPAAAAEAGAGRDKLGASWPARRRVRNVVEVVKPMRIDRHTIGFYFTRGCGAPI